MKRIIGISGLIGSGKTTIAKYLQERYSFIPISMADSLKELVSNLFGWEREIVNGDTPETREKREELDPYWSGALGRNWSPRIALQFIGTEVMRNNLHNDIWLMSLKQKIDASPSDARFVIPDIRFANEMQMVRDLHGQIWRVEYTPQQPKWYQEVKQFKSAAAISAFMNSGYREIHNSEWACLHVEPDVMIINDTDIQSLYVKVDELMA